MKEFEIIKTDNYLLIVSDEEIKDGDFFTPLSGIGFKLLSIIKAECENDGTKGWNDDHCKKIIAHLPLNNAPILEGVALLPELEDDVEKLAEDYKNKKGSVPTTKLEDEIFKLGFKDGYAAATKVYSEKDLRKAFNFGANEGYNYKDLESIGEEPEELSEEDWNNFVKTFKQPKTPKWFIAEMEQYDLDNKRWKITLKTITNSQSKEVLVGTYKFE